MIIVFDTNVLFAAFASRSGFCALVVRECLLRPWPVAISPYIYDELARTLEAKLHLGAASLELVLSVLRDACVFTTPAAVPSDAARDPADLPVLGTAVAAGAAVLVTGDNDLLALGSYRGITILSPRDFHARYLAS